MMDAPQNKKTHTSVHVVPQMALNRKVPQVQTTRYCSSKSFRFLAKAKGTRNIPIETDDC